MRTQAKERVVEALKKHLPFGSELQGDIADDLPLSELGLDSLHLITMLMTLQREYSLDIGEMVARGMPTTMGDLLALMERGLPGGKSESHPQVI